MDISEKRKEEHEQQMTNAESVSEDIYEEVDITVDDFEGDDLDTELSMIDMSGEMDMTSILDDDDEEDDFALDYAELLEPADEFMQGLDGAEADPMSNEPAPENGNVVSKSNDVDVYQTKDPLDIIDNGLDIDYEISQEDIELAMDDGDLPDAVSAIIERKANKQAVVTEDEDDDITSYEAKAVNIFEDEDEEREQPEAISQPEPDDFADVMLIDIDDVADTPDEKEALRGGAAIPLAEGEAVAKPGEAEFYQRELYRKSVSAYGSADETSSYLPAGGSIGESEIVGEFEEQLDISKEIDRPSHKQMDGQLNFPEIGKMSNVLAIYDSDKREIRLGDKMAFGTCYDLIGEVVGIGRNCFFTIHAETAVDGSVSYVADQWVLEEKSRFYHYVEDNLTYIIDDIMDESISLEELSGRFRDVIRSMRSKKGISHQRYLDNLKRNQQL